MNVEKIIIDLLYKYDCVIIPGFGGFVAQRKSAIFHPMDYTFDPPRKVVGFNSDLTHSDGLLAQEIAKRNHVSYAEALDAINLMVKSWQDSINNGKTVEIEDLGSFKLINSKLDFTPQKDLNFSFDSFGMFPVKGKYILRQPENTSQTTTASSNSWLSYAAAIGFALTVGTAGFFANDNLIQPQLSSVLPLLNNHTPSHTNVIETPVAPIIQLESNNDATLKNAEPVVTALEENETTIVAVSDEEERDLSIKTYQVIGGSFKVYSKAMEHRAYLKQKGYDRAVIVGKVGNFYMVAYDTFNNLEEAVLYKKELEKKGYDVFMRP